MSLLPTRFRDSSNATAGLRRSLVRDAVASVLGMRDRHITWKACKHVRIRDGALGAHDAAVTSALTSRAHHAGPTAQRHRLG